MTDDITTKTLTVLDSFRAVRDSVDNLQRLVTSTERERIGELERDLAHAKAAQSALEAQATYDALEKGRTISVLQEENAKLRALIAGKAVPMHEDVIGTMGGVDVVEVKPAEERGPWVIVDGEGFFIDDEGDQVIALRSAYRHRTLEGAEKEIYASQRVVTLAEARDIEKARK